MFSLYDCRDIIVNGTLVPQKLCYECDTFCEFSIFVFTLLLISCCLKICFSRKKIVSKEILTIEPESPPPYS